LALSLLALSNADAAAQARKLEAYIS